MITLIIIFIIVHGIWVNFVTIVRSLIDKDFTIRVNFVSEIEIWEFKDIFIGYNIWNHGIFRGRAKTRGNIEESDLLAIANSATINSFDLFIFLNATIEILIISAIYWFNSFIAIINCFTNSTSTSFNLLSYTCSNGFGLRNRLSFR